MQYHVWKSNRHIQGSENIAKSLNLHLFSQFFLLLLLLTRDGRKCRTSVQFNVHNNFRTFYGGLLLFKFIPVSENQVFVVKVSLYKLSNALVRSSYIKYILLYTNYILFGVLLPSYPSVVWSYLICFYLVTSFLNSYIPPQNVDGFMELMSVTAVNTDFTGWNKPDFIKVQKQSRHDSRTYYPLKAKKGMTIV